MIATTYNIYAFDNFNRLYLTHFGRFGSEAPYTFSVLSREKCGITIRTSTNGDRANKVFLSIGGYFYSTYTMPNSDELEIDITDIISSLNFATYRTNVTIETNETQKSYEFDLSISYGLDFIRLDKLMGHQGETAGNGRCPLYGRINATTGRRELELIAMPEELIVPYTENYVRRFTYLTYFTIYCWTQYGAGAIDVYQNGVKISQNVGSNTSIIIKTADLKPLSQWSAYSIGTRRAFGVPRSMKNAILLKGTLPYQIYQNSLQPTNRYKFAFFLEILEIGENVDVENLMPNASAMPYTLRQEMRMKVGIRNISRYDYIIYSMFYLCDDLQVFFDDYIDKDAQSQISTERGYNARLKSKDFVMPNTERTDFILDLIISY